MEMNYTSEAVGNAGLATGIIGTALGVLNGAGGLFNTVHGGNAAGGQYITKEVNDVQYRLIESERNNAILSADLASERKMVEVFNAANNHTNAVRDELRAEIRAVENRVTENAAAQGVINANVSAQQAINTSQISQLFSLTKLVVPNGSVCPGWGDVKVTPA